MGKLPLSKLNQAVLESQTEAIGVTLDPKTPSLFTQAVGMKPVVVVALTLFEIFTVCFFGKDSAVSIISILAYFGLCACLLLKHPQQPRIHITQQNLKLEGIISEKTLLPLAQQLIMQTAIPKLPEPDAKVDVKTKKTIPFRPGEKEEILKEQKEMEEKAGEVLKLQVIDEVKTNEEIQTKTS